MIENIILFAIPLRAT